jgi:hypothetical protein
MTPETVLATPRSDAADGRQDLAMLGGVQRRPDTANSQAAQGEIAGREDPTAASQRLVFDELAEIADLIESFAIGLREAARRADRVRAHGYICDIGRCFGDARSAYARISALAGLEARR